MSAECKKEKCQFWDEGKCPFFIETKWTNETSGTTKIKQDCAPRRAVLLHMNMQSHIMGLKTYASETRNMLARLAKDTTEFMIVQSDNSDQTSRTVDQIAKRQNKMLLDQRKANKPKKEIK